MEPDTQAAPPKPITINPSLHRTKGADGTPLLICPCGTVLYTHYAPNHLTDCHWYRDTYPQPK